MTRITLDHRRARWRRVGTPAAWALRTHRGTALLLAAAGGIGLVAVLPVTLLRARLAAPLVRAADLGLGRGGLASSPNQLRAAALSSLSQLLLIVAVGVVCVAALSVLAVAFARARTRGHELAVRRAVGASRGLLVAAALIEGGVIAAVTVAWGGAGGVSGGRLALDAWPGPVRPPAGTALGWAMLAAVAALVLLGVLLPLASQRGRHLLAPRSGRALELVVPAVQLGLSLTVLATAALLARRATQLRGGGDSRRGPDGDVYAITLNPRDSARAAERYADLLRRLHRQPGVTGASLTSPGTILGLGENDGVVTDCGQCGWGGLYVPFHPVYATQFLASADTFRMLGLRLLAGRPLRDSDDATAPRVAVVSRSLAAAHFQDQQAVGRRVQVGHAPQGARWYTVVGVVADQLPSGFGGGLEPAAAVYLSVLQHPIPAVDLLVRTEDGRAADGIERDLSASLGSSHAATSHVRESRALAAEAAPIRWFGRLFGVEGWVMLAVAGIGTFIVLRLWVTSLLPELGIRRAVGARRRDLYRFVLVRAVGVAAAGVAIGIWSGGLLWGTLTAVVAGLPVWDTGVAVRVGALLSITALVGAVVPAWAAGRAAPAGLVGRDIE